MTSYQIQCSMGSTYTTVWIHCLLAQPVQPYSNVTVWTTLSSRVSFSWTGSVALSQIWSWPGYQCLVEHAVLQAAKPLQGPITSNYNAWQTCNVLAEFGTAFYVALDWLWKASAISGAAPEACSSAKETLQLASQPLLPEHQNAAERTTFHQQGAEQELLHLPPLAEPQWNGASTGGQR